MRILFVALVFAVTIVGYADRQIIALLKPALDQALGWSATDYATITTLFQIAAAASLLVAGPFIDRVGVVRGFAIGLGGWSLAAVAHAWARSVAQFATARVALGVFEAVGTPAVVKAVAILFNPERRALVLGIVNVAPNIAAIVTPLLVSSLFAILGWKGTIVAVGASGLVLLALWLMVPWSRLSPLLGSGQATGAGRPIPITRVLRDRRVWSIGLAKLLVDQAWWFMLFWLPDFFHRRFGLDMRHLGAPLASIYAMAAGGALAGGLLPAILARRGTAVAVARRLVMGASALTVLPIAFVTNLNGANQAILVVGLALASHQVFSTNLFALVADLFPVGEVASAMGFGAFCGNVGGILSLHLAGVSLADLGTLQPLFVAASLGYGMAWLVLNLRHPAPGLVTS